MKKLYIKIKSLNKQIRETTHEVETVNTLPFYTVFKQEDQRDIDRALLIEHKRELLNQKYATLESLQIEIEKCKADISQELQTINHLKIIDNDTAKSA